MSNAWHTRTRRSLYKRNRVNVADENKIQKLHRAGAVRVFASSSDTVTSASDAWTVVVTGRWTRTSATTNRASSIDFIDRDRLLRANLPNSSSSVHRACLVFAIVRTDSWPRVCNKCLFDRGFVRGFGDVWISRRFSAVRESCCLDRRRR